MNPRKYITDPKILLEEGKAIMTSEREYVIYAFKVFKSHTSKTVF